MATERPNPSACAMRMEGVLRAHGFMRVERPPEMREVAVADVPFLRLLGELIVAGLARGTPLAALVLSVANVVVEADGPAGLAPGEYVALTIRGGGAWGPELTWSPALASAPRLLTPDLDAAARQAGVALAYTRVLGPTEGSITPFLPRRPGSDVDG